VWAPLNLPTPVTAPSKWLMDTVAANASTSCRPLPTMQIEQLDSDGHSEGDLLAVHQDQLCLTLVYRLDGALVTASVTDSLQDLVTRPSAPLFLQTGTGGSIDLVVHLIAFRGDVGPVHAVAGSDTIEVHQAVIDVAGRPAATLVVVRGPASHGSAPVPDVCTTSGVCQSGR
jgi:hypothetical protein